LTIVYSFFSPNFKFKITLARKIRLFIVSVKRASMMTIFINTIFWCHKLLAFFKHGSQLVTNLISEEEETWISWINGFLDFYTSCRYLFYSGFRVLPSLTISRSELVELSTHITRLIGSNPVGLDLEGQNTSVIHYWAYRGQLWKCIEEHKNK